MQRCMTWGGIYTVQYQSSVLLLFPHYTVWGIQPMWLSRGDVTNGNHSATSMSVVEWCCVWLGYSLTSRIDILICYLSFGCQEECILDLGKMRVRDVELISILVIHKEIESIGNVTWISAITLINGILSKPMFIRGDGPNGRHSLQIRCDSPTLVIRPTGFQTHIIKW
jgi:hypothetical protein